MKKGIVIISFLLLGFFLHLGVNWAKKESLEWFSGLSLPAWMPSSLNFTRIWAGAFIFNSISGALLWLGPRGRPRTLALEIWGVQFILNGIWHFTFYYFHNPLLTACDLTLLVFVLAVCIFAAKRVDPAAAVLLIPYGVWVFYATNLFWTIYAMNMS